MAELLPEKVLFVMVSVPEVFKMPAPPPAAAALPFLTVTPEMFTVNAPMT